MPRKINGNIALPQREHFLKTQHKSGNPRFAPREKEKSPHAYHENSPKQKTLGNGMGGTDRGPFRPSAT